MTKKIYCPIRKLWLTAQPEEIVRQSLIQQLLYLNYPQGNIALEISLSQLSHSDPLEVPPKRRADLIVFSTNLHPAYNLYPLLLVECKAVPFSSKVARQIIGYNHFVKAPFIALVNQTTTFLGCYSPEKKDFHFQEGLLSYPELLKKAKDFINQRGDEKIRNWLFSQPQTEM